MTRATGDDPLDELRQSNPADSRHLPSASLARVRARVQEATVMEQRTRRSRWPLALGAAASVAAIALVAVIALPATRPTPPPTAAPTQVAVVTPEPSTGGGVIGSCVEQYSLDSLKGRDHAFDGTALSIAGDEVTFRVNTSFRGTTGDEMTLTATGMTGTTITSGGGLTLAVGERYLVAGDDTFVWGCGFTQPYDTAVAAQWAATLGS